GFTYSTTDIGDSITAYFFPRRKEGEWDGKDTYIEQLNKLTDLKRDTIRIIMSKTWTGSRGENLAQKLKTLQSEVAVVEIITMENLPGQVPSILNSIKAKGGYVKLHNNKEKVHSKIMLLKGVWNGKMQRIIYMGSENF